MSDEAEKDALIESLERQIAALTGSVQDISTGWDKTLDQLAEREAVIESQARHIEKLSEDTKDTLRVWDKTMEQLAEREAVIERVRAYAEDRAFHARGHLNTVNSGRIASDLQAILAASPVSVLAEHDARVLEELAAEAATSFGWLDPDDAGRASRWIASRAAEYRKGAGQ